MWDCTHCGVRSIAGSIQVCPRCHEPRYLLMQDPVFVEGGLVDKGPEAETSPEDEQAAVADANPAPEGKEKSAKGK